MKVNVKKEENNIVKLDIEIPAKDAVAEYNKAAQKISQYANIPGFRKGKAPRNLVEKHYGAETIKHEALDALLPRIFQDAIISNKLDVISQPYVEAYDFEVGKDLKVTARVELRPEVKLGEYKNLTIEAEEYATPDDAFDKALDSLLQRNAAFNLVVDRKTKNTDLVTIDFDGSVDGEKIQGGAAESYPLDLANSNFIPGFAEQIVGHKLDEEFDIKVEFPKDYHETKIAGKPAVFKIKIKEIKEKVLPELTNEFAQKVGPFKTVEDLKVDIQKYLDSTKESEDKKKSEQAVLDKIIGSVKVEIQPSMIEKEANTLLDEYKQRLTMQGFNPEDAIKSQGDSLMDELKKEAESRIKYSLVVDKIAQEEDIKIDQNDIEKRFKEIESAYRLDRQTFLNQLKQNPDMFGALSHQALTEKVIDFLMNNNKIEFKAAKKSKSKKSS